MRVGIFGGTFNPPHIGHLLIAEWMLGEFELNRVLWIPAAQSPFKANRETVDPAHRMEMVRCAVQGNPSFDVSDCEIRRGGTSYTIDTVRHLSESRPSDEFFLLMGSDSLQGFPRWKDARAIAELVDLLVFKRPGDPDPPIPEYAADKVRFAEAPLIEISSTRIRERCRARQSVRYLVADAVRVYIEARGLYNGGA